MSRDHRRHKAGTGIPQHVEHKPYQWPPPRDPSLEHREQNRNPIHAVITALPVLMLLVGLYFYYASESRQSDSSPIRVESVEVQGLFNGLSSTQGRYYLWIERDGQPKGLRVQAEQHQRLQAMQRSEPVLIKMAPSVKGSTTYWAWYVEQNGQVFLDAGDTLQ